MDGMERLVSDVKKLKNSEISLLVKARISEFKKRREASEEEIFKELCFCLLTANFSAKEGIRIQNALNDGFIYLPREELENRLRELGHRYPRVRAEYIVEARKLLGKLKSEISRKDPRVLREWLVKNVKGLGYKEASHLLRNVGFENVAIIDFHILDLLERYGVIKKPKTLTRRRYLEIEDKLRKIAELSGTSLGELDLYLWYLETGKILK